MNVVLVIFIGILAGIFAGLFGIGGGTVIIPLLVFALGMNQHTAQGTSLVALLLPVGLLATIEYYRNGNANIKMGLLIGIGLFIGGYLGAYIANKMDDPSLRKIFALFLMFVAIKMFLKS